MKTVNPCRWFLCGFESWCWSKSSVLFAVEEVDMRCGCNRSWIVGSVFFYVVVSGFGMQNGGASAPRPRYEIWLTQDRRVNGVVFRRRSYLFFHGSKKTRVKSGMLAHTQKIRGVWLKGGTEAHFHPAGVLRKGVLHKDAKVGGIVFAANRTIEFFTSRNVRCGALRKRTRVGRRRYPAQAKKEVCFYKNGRVAHFTPARAVSFGAVRMQRGRRVDLYHNGGVRKGVLATKTRVGTVVLAARSRVRFHFAKQKLKAGVLAHGQKVNGVRLPTRSKVFFHATGSLRKAILAQKTQVQSFRLAAGSHVVFSTTPPKSVSRLSLPADGKINGILFKGGSHAMRAPGMQRSRKVRWWIAIHNNGKVAQGRLARDARVQGLWFKADTLLCFHPNGRVKKGYLARPAVVKGFRLPAGHRLELAKDGTLSGRASLPLARGRRIHGRYFPAGTVVATYDGGRSIHAVIVQRKFKLGRIRLPPKTYFHFSRGRLSWITLPRPTRIGSIVYAKNGRVWIDSKGRVSCGPLAKRTRLKGFVFMKNRRLCLWPNGNPMKGYLAGDQKSGGVLYRGGKRVAFFKNRVRIKKGVLARTQRVGKLVLKGGSKLSYHTPNQMKAYSPARGPFAAKRFFAKGGLKSLYLRKAMRLRGVRFPAKAAVSFRRNGQFRHVVFVEPGRLQGMWLRNTAYLYRNGRVRKGVLAKAQKVGRFRFRKGAIYLHQNGRPRAGNLARARRIQSVPVKKGSHVKFYRNGRLRSCSAARAGRVGKRRYKAGQRLTFSAKGRLLIAR
jgi:hypothetical protein